MGKRYAWCVEMQPNRNCPFYGRYLFGSLSHVDQRPFMLLDSYGNQCAVIMVAHSPCYLEVEGKPVDWRECQRVKDLTP